MPPPPQEFCKDENPVLSDLAVQGSNLRWYADSLATTALPESTRIPGDTVFYATQAVNGCEGSPLAVEVEVHPLPDAVSPGTLARCDRGGDGFVKFRLSKLNDTVSGGAENVNVKYFRTRAEAENGGKGLPENYTNENSPTQTLYARVTDTGTGCYAITGFELEVVPVPEIANLNDLSGCANANGEAVFNLRKNDTAVLGTQAAENLRITYHHTQTEAENGEGAIGNPENFENGAGEIFVRLADPRTGCSDTGSFALEVNPRPAIGKTPISLKICSDTPGGQTATIDLTQLDGRISTAENTEVVYYADAEGFAEKEAIENPGNFVNENNPQTLLAEVVNINTGCASQQQVEIELGVNPRPEVDLSPYEGNVICTDLDPSTPVEGGNFGPVRLETGLSPEQYSFTWSREGQTLEENGPDLEITEAGNYRVKVTGPEGCSTSSEAEILAGSPPEFNLESTGAFRTPLTAQVTDIRGDGPYSFSIDGRDLRPEPGPNGLRFEGLPAGRHSVRGRSIGGCGATVHHITLIGYPKFFTPNGDGINDRWNITGLEGKSGVEIYIFDRFGKLLTSIGPDGAGWDGTYNGKRMPSNDYWFKVEYPTAEGNQKSFRANFTLKR